MLSGLPHIELEDWKRHALYTGTDTREAADFGPASQMAKWFWAAVEAMQQEDRARLLQFTTGASRLPPGGFKDLMGYHGPQRFTLALNVAAKPNALPTASTCFNLLKLPMSRTQEALADALHTAARHGAEGFSFA